MAYLLSNHDLIVILTALLTDNFFKVRLMCKVQSAIDSTRLSPLMWFSFHFYHAEISTEQQKNEKRP